MVACAPWRRALARASRLMSGASSVAPAWSLLCGSQASTCFGMCKPTGLATMTTSSLVRLAAPHAPSATWRPAGRHRDVLPTWSNSASSDGPQQPCAQEVLGVFEILGLDDGPRSCRGSSRLLCLVGQERRARPHGRPEILARRIRLIA